MTLDLFAGGSHANHSALPGSEAAQRTTVISGQRCYALYRKLTPLGLLVKMLLESSVWHSKLVHLKWKAEPLAEEKIRTISLQYSHDKKSCCSTLYVKTLSAKLTKSSRLLFRLLPSMPDTGETEYGLWPTPTASNATQGPNIPDGKRGATLVGILKRPGLWPTPRTNDAEKRGNFANDVRNGLPAAVKFWPTPNACSGNNSGRLDEWEGRGQLNPTWVEWLMGYPEGWTDLEHLETP